MTRATKMVECSVAGIKLQRTHLARHSTCYTPLYSETTPWCKSQESGIKNQAWIVNTLGIFKIDRKE